MIKITKRLLTKAPEKIRKPLLVSLVIACVIISVLVPAVVGFATGSIILWIPANFLCQYICFVLIQCFLGEFLRMDKNIQTYSTKRTEPDPRLFPKLTDFLCSKINLLPESLQFRGSMVLYAILITLPAILPKLILKLAIPFISISAVAIPLSILLILIGVIIFMPIAQFYYWNTILIPELEEIRE